jgi:hypothetical protein
VSETDSAKTTDKIKVKDDTVKILSNLPNTKNSEQMNATTKERKFCFKLSLIVFAPRPTTFPNSAFPDAVIIDKTSNK